MENPLRPNTKLREERLRRGWSQQKVADQLGIAVVTINRWERGRQQPTAYYRLKLSSLFDKSVADLGLLEDETEERAEESFSTPLGEQEDASEDLSPNIEPYPISMEKEQSHPSFAFRNRHSERSPLSTKGKLFLVVALLFLVIALPITFFLSHSPRTAVIRSSSPSFTTGTPPSPLMFMPPSKWRLTLDDPMTKAQHNVQWNIDENCTFHSDGYYVASQGTNYCNYGGSSANHFSSIAYSIDMIFYKGVMGGLVFRLTDNQYYGFYITTTGRYRVLWHKSSNGGDDKTLIDASSALIHKGLHQKNTLSVYAQGSSLVFWINGQQVARRMDKTYTSGTIGTFVGNPDDNSNATTEILFRNAQVWIP